MVFDRIVNELASAFTALLVRRGSHCPNLWLPDGVSSTAVARSTSVIPPEPDTPIEPVESSLPKKPVTERGWREIERGVDVPEIEMVTRSLGSSLSTEEKLFRGTEKSRKAAEKVVFGGCAGSIAEIVAVPSNIPCEMPRARTSGKRASVAASIFDQATEIVGLPSAPDKEPDTLPPRKSAEKAAACWFSRAEMMLGLIHTFERESRTGSALMRALLPVFTASSASIESKCTPSLDPFVPLHVIFICGDCAERRAYCAPYERICGQISTSNVAAMARSNNRYERIRRAMRYLFIASKPLTSNCT